MLLMINMKLPDRVVPFYFNPSAVSYISDGVMKLKTGETIDIEMNEWDLVRRINNTKERD